MAMRCSARSLVGRLMPAGGNSRVAGPSMPGWWCTTASMVPAQRGVESEPQRQYKYETSMKARSITSSKGKAKQTLSSVGALGFYHRSEGIRLGQTISASIFGSHRAQRTLHTSCLVSNSSTLTSSRTSSASSSTAKLSSPPASPSSSLPAAFAGLGTTQLSPDIMLRCTIFDSRGSATSSSGVFKKSRLCSEHGLEPRDLRKIDSRVPNLVPTILARRGGILVNILHIRAMIKKDKVLLFDSYGSTDSQLHSAFVYNLQHNLRPVGAGGLAYEFRALESILVSVLDALRIELGVVRGWTAGVLEELDDDVDREKLRTLLQVSRKLNAFLSRAKAVKGAVVEVLENEEDMQLMYLSTSPPSPPASSLPSSTSTTSPATSASSTMTEENESGSAGMDELELLLESFDKQVEEVVAETTQLSSDISNTQEVVELILDNNRNKLLALDLKTSIVTMGVSVGTLWAGLFGMNLKSHIEEVDWAFGLVSGVALTAVVLTAGVGLRRLERLRRVGLGQGQAQGQMRKKVKPAWLNRWKGAKKVEAPVWQVHPQSQSQPYPYALAGTTSSVPYTPGWQSHPAPSYASSAAMQPTSVAAATNPTLAPPSTTTQNGWPTPFPSSFSSFSSPSQTSPSTHPAPPHPNTATAPQEAPELGLGLGSKWNSSTSTNALAKKRKSKPSPFT